MVHVYLRCCKLSVGKKFVGYARESKCVVISIVILLCCVEIQPEAPYENSENGEFEFCLCIYAQKKHEFDQYRIH